MSVAVLDPPRLMTVEEFLALPDDGFERYLIDGEIRPRDRGMTLRNHRHAGVEANTAALLKEWVRLRPEPRGRVVSGEAGFRLKGDAETLVGADVAYVSPELRRRLSGREPYFPGPPVIAVEILSPSDKHEEIVLKVEAYLRVGTIVWVIDPDFQTVAVHRPGSRVVETYTALDELTVEPELPGFRAPISRFFEDID